MEALCWCGRRATHNARTVDGVMVVEGDQMVVGDVDAAPVAAEPGEPVIGYETLCRRHHMRRQTSGVSPSLASNEIPLPFDAGSPVRPGNPVLSLLDH